MQKNCEFDLPSFKGTVVDINSVDKNKFDILIATSWQSAFYLKLLSGYKMYFIQDFEPEFFRMSERKLLALETYRMGYHMVSLGTWNKKRIETSVKETVKVDVIDFPYEPKEYGKSVPNRVVLNKNQYDLAVYVKEEGKRLPNLTLSIIEKAKEELKKYSIELNCHIFGLASKRKLSFGENLGKLNKNELKELYKKCDFGMAMSMTNISLVPLEMIASGLFVLEAKDGSFSSFFDTSNYPLVTLDYHSLVDIILKINRGELDTNKLVKKCKEKISNLSWFNTASQFDEIIRKVISHE
jgi:glycosyltransferase involved in cell wall biosynthesis